MTDKPQKPVLWQKLQVTSPLLEEAVSVVAARGVPYIEGGNRLQSLNLYLPFNEENDKLVGTPANALPKENSDSKGVHYQVHVHGGAWRDPHLSGTSIEPQVAHSFQNGENGAGLLAIASINYTLTKFPTHPDDPYDPELNHHSDPAREAQHPQHVSDVIHGLNFLRDFGLEDHSYILTCHSCGAGISFQSILQAPSYYGLHELADPPAPAAIIGLNGLYDLPGLVYQEDAAHQHTAADYRVMLTNAFGTDESIWAAASPTRFDPQVIAGRVQAGKAPSLVVIAESKLDQLVPMNQVEKLEANLKKVGGMKVVRSTRSVGYHALPWEAGRIFWECIQDTVTLLRQ